MLESPPEIILVSEYQSRAFILKYVQPQNLRIPYRSSGPCPIATAFEREISCRVVEAFHLRGVRVHSKTPLPYALLDLAIDRQVILTDGLGEFQTDRPPDPACTVWQKGARLFPAAQVVDGKPDQKVTLGYMLANGQKLGALIRKTDGPMDIELEIFLDLYRLPGTEDYIK